MPKRDSFGVSPTSEGNTYAGKPESSRIEFIVSNYSKEPKKVWIDGSKVYPNENSVQVSYQEENRALVIRTVYDYTELNIKIKN